MSKHLMIQPRVGAKTSAWITAILLAAAAVAVLFGVSLAVSPEDNERFESVLILSVARQLVRGPWELYGPFGGSNPLVIIHAPLYYHLAALMAWPLYRGGLDHVTAALAAGRALSFLGLGWTLVAAYRLARLDGTPRSAGWWAVLLIAASPVVGVMPYTVRPDMLGVALQTTGVLLVLSVLRSERPKGITLAAAFAAFGLALCVKQHYVMAPAVSMFLVMSAWLRGSLSFNVVTRGLLTGLAIVLLLYGTEELVTGGRMSQAVFRAASTASRVHPADSARAEMVLSLLAGKSSGLVEIMMAVGLASVGAHRGTGRAALVVGGTSLMGLIALWSLLNTFDLVAISRDMVIGEGLLIAAVFFVIPACFLVAPRNLLAARLDRVVWIYLATELGLVTILGRMSTGAWLNYGIQAVVFASVLSGRGLVQALEHSHMLRQVLPIALAAPVSLISVCGIAVTTTRLRSAERIERAQIFDRLKHPSTEFFFVNRPGENRLCGRLDLVYDDWLYPVFESIHQAEQRSIWLENALTSDAVSVIVNTSESPNIDGLGETLPQLGYVHAMQQRTFYVWRRSPLVVPNQTK
jgi:Dolichyl-phosphate-mannose-protein mannosyltransferase